MLVYCTTDKQEWRGDERLVPLSLQFADEQSDEYVVIVKM